MYEHSNMPRLARLDARSVLHHVMGRGIERRGIFAPLASHLDHLWHILISVLVDICLRRCYRRNMSRPWRIEFKGGQGSDDIFFVANRKIL